MNIASALDYRIAAKRKLPRFLFDYIDGGSYAEHTLNKNISDLAEVTLKQRILKNVRDLSLETEVFGQKLAMPVILSPVGLTGMYARIIAFAFLLYLKIALLLKICCSYFLSRAVTMYFIRFYLSGCQRI